MRDMNNGVRPPEKYSYQLKQSTRRNTMFKKAMALTMALLISGFMVTLSAAPKMKPCNALKIDR
jgi:hypothetical protein